MRPPVTVGELIRISEEDYCYGRGELTLQVTEVPTQLQDPDWSIFGASRSRGTASAVVSGTYACA